MTPLAADLAIGQDAYLLLGAGLFAIGLVGLMVRKSALIMLMCVELMLNACNLAFVAGAHITGVLDGQVVAFFVMVVAAAEVVVGLAIIVCVGVARWFTTSYRIDDEDVALRTGVLPSAWPLELTLSLSTARIASVDSC